MNCNKIVWIVALIVLLQSVTAFSVNLDSPLNNTFFANQDITFLYTPQGIENIMGCCLFINDELRLCNQSIQSNIQNSFSVSLADGTFVWNLNCSYANQSDVSTKRLFTIDTLNPVVIIMNPIVGSWQSGVIKVMHAEADANIKECSYSYGTSSWYPLSCNSSFDFDTMKCIDGTNSCVLQIKAIDKAGNQNAQMTVFSVDNKYPTAAITLSDNSPIKEGIVEVTLQVSEDLREAPSLDYSLDTTPNIRQPISLAGSGRLWKGYMIIAAYGNRVGTFYFRGTDIAGNNGTLITDGKLFLIDTQKPTAPNSIKLTREKNDDLKIEWYYEGEPPDHFIIYRSTDGTVDYVDQYATSQNNYYVDTDIDTHKTYYYRISAVDAAGNNGALSGQVSISPDEHEVIQEGQEEKKQETKEEIKEPTQQPPPVEQPKPKESDITIKDMLNEINRLSVDISWVISNFQNKEDVIEKHLITDLELMVQASNAQLDTEELRKELIELQSSTASEDLKMKQLTMIELRIKKIRQTTPKDIVIREKNEFIQSITDDDVRNAVDELVGENTNFTLFVKNDYKDKAMFIQPQVNVNTEIDIFTLEYLDKSKINKTIINKKISYNSPDTLQDVVLIDIIPKNVVYSVNDMDIKTTGYEVLKEDPVLVWKFSTFNYEEKQIKYILNEEIDVGRVKGIKSIILKEPLKFLAEKESTKISGFSIFTFGDTPGLLGKTGSISVIIGFVIVILLSGYYFVFIKGLDGFRFPLIKRFSELDVLKKQITEKLREANDYVEIDDYERIKSLYPKIKHLYDRLPKQDKSEFYDKCVGLYKRIIMLTKK